MPIDREKLQSLTSKEKEILSRSKTPSMNGLQHLVGQLEGFNYRAIPSIPFEFRSKLPSVTGIYVLYLECDVYYVGQSVKIGDRWKSHHIEDKLAMASEVLVSPDLRIGWIEVDKSLLDFAERYLIGLLLPILNVTHNSRYSDADD